MRQTLAHASLSGSLARAYLWKLIITAGHFMKVDERSRAYRPAVGYTPSVVGGS